MNAADFDWFGGVGASNWMKNLQGNTAMTTPTATAGAAGIPQVGVPAAAGSGIGWNMDTLKIGLGGLQTIGNIYNAYQANKLAKDTFKYQKGITDQNMANSLQSYNTSLADRIRSRTFTEGGTQASADEYIQKNQLRRQY